MMLCYSEMLVGTEIFLILEECEHLYGMVREGLIYENTGFYGCSLSNIILSRLRRDEEMAMGCSCL